MAALVMNGVTEFELASACEVFGYERAEIKSPWYRFVLAKAEPVVRSELGLIVDSPHGLDAVRRADTVIALPPVQADYPEDVLDAIRAADKRGARLLSMCTGAFVLAAAGVLDGRPATTHWRYAEELARRHPAIKVDPNVLYVDDGDVLTSAGTAASIDLCLHVVRLDHGADIANAIARRMVVPPHRDGGQAQFIDRPIGPHRRRRPARIGPRMGARAPRGAAVGRDLAERAAMSGRTFARRFRQVTGTTPHQWLLTQRVLLAQRLLESTDDAVELVAHDAGSATPRDCGRTSSAWSAPRRWRTGGPFERPWVDLAHSRGNSWPFGPAIASRIRRT